MTSATSMLAPSSTMDNVSAIPLEFNGEAYDFDACVDVDDYWSKRLLKKSVSFGNLVEMQFAVEKGDPALWELDYPMQLGNTMVDQSSYQSVDDYEALREHEPVPSNEWFPCKTEERRQIIKESKKLAKEARRRLRRRNSIGNGQISRLGALFGVASREELLCKVYDPPSEPITERPIRPRLRRENSIGNGQIYRDNRRNRVQEFLKLMSVKN